MAQTNDTFKQLKHWVKVKKKIVAAVNKKGEVNCL